MGRPIFSKSIAFMNRIREVHWLSDEKGPFFIAKVVTPHEGPAHDLTSFYWRDPETDERPSKEKQTEELHRMDNSEKPTGLAALLHEKLYYSLDELHDHPMIGNATVFVGNTRHSETGERVEIQINSTRMKDEMIYPEGHPEEEQEDEEVADAA